MTDFSTNIKKYRKEKGISQDELAKIIKKKFKVDIAQNTISQYENGTREPNFEMVKKIATALEIPLEDLLGIKIADQEDIDKLLENIPNEESKRFSNDMKEAAHTISSYFFKDHITEEKLEIPYTKTDMNGMTVQGVKDVSIQNRYQDLDYLKYKIKFYQELLDNLTKDETKPSKAPTQEDIDKMFK